MTEELKVRPGSDALIVVDVQRDFCPGGALAVPHGDEVVRVLNRWLAIPGLFKVATRDWHPPNHCSFDVRGGPWPAHCVEGTPGAEFHPDLDVARVDKVVSKATEPDAEAYSGFDAPELARTLHDHEIRRVWIGGLATDYCVKATAVDACTHGFTSFVLTDAVRGIDAEPGDAKKALKEMEEAGARLTGTENVRTER
jgi:nicotinamidase/pyrazinamidase